MIWDSFQTKIKCKRLTLHNLWNLSYVRMHMYTWLECAHNLRFSAVFLFQKEFYFDRSPQSSYSQPNQNRLTNVRARRLKLEKVPLK